MKAKRPLTRRSFLARVVGGTVAGAGALVVLNDTAQATTQGWSDSDPSDPIGGGRRPCTDRDRGRNGDPAGRGRGTGRTDSDTGAGRDRAGCGRR
jgi:hypothetical protein